MTVTPFPWTGIVIHHSKGSDDKVRMSFDEIVKFHTDPGPPAGTGRGWSDVGYHKIIECVEGKYISIDGRPLDKVGAHAPPRNFDTLGICFVGDFDVARPDPMMLEFAAHVVIAPLINVLGLKFPKCLHRHSEITPGRQCPGLMFDFEDLLARVARRLGYV